jgi:16S rRNA (guanine527-N7)-methyltransferase
MNPLWTDLAARANVTLTEQQHARLAQYLELLADANVRMNLTRITDRAAAEVQHVGDALTVLPFIPAGNVRVADVGSGGGVPGLPLAIARPDVHVVLIEATKKKAAYLHDAAKQLKLTNVTVADVRAEEAGQDRQLRESFDVVVARAVATMAWLAEWCLPLAKKGGSVLAMKGPKVAEELPLAEAAIAACNGADDPVVHPVELPGTEHRVIVQIKKLGKTHPRYPRPAPAAKGKPIG